MSSSVQSELARASPISLVRGLDLVQSSTAPQHVFPIALVIVRERVQRLCF
jgi:hypothetical protein